MCCRNDAKLLAKLRARKKAFVGWKLYDWYGTYLKSHRWSNLPGGTVKSPGIVDSKQGSRPLANGSFVTRGIHVYLSRRAAMSELCSKVRIVPVIVRPRYIRAAGAVCENDTHVPLTWLGRQLVASRVRISESAWQKATKP